MAAQHGPPDPLYSMAVPDRSGFVYERDTPLIPTQTAAPLIRESLPPDTYMVRANEGVKGEIGKSTPKWGVWEWWEW